MPSSKAIGGEFERKVCVTLSLWVTDGARDDVFWRSAMSGGRHTTKRKSGARAASQAGDISAVASEGLPFLEVFGVECKKYKDLKFDAHFWGLKGLIAELWDVHYEMCADMKRIPLLIAQQERKPSLLLTDATGTRLLRRHGACPTARLYVVHGPVTMFILSQVLRIPWKQLAKDLGVWVPPNRRREVLR